MKNFDELFQNFELMGQELILSDQQKYIARQLAVIRLLEKYDSEFQKIIIEEEEKILANLK